MWGDCPVQQMNPSNKSDAANPAMALWLTIEDQWRRVADLERWAPLRAATTHN
jgi:hypothetical protein